MNKIWKIVWLAVIAIPLCGNDRNESADSISYQQQDRQIVSVRKFPKRVVITYGSLAKVWDLAGGKAVGVPTLPAKNALPESMRNLPSSGSPTVPNIEAIVALKPDLVLLIGKLQKQRACGELLRSMKIDAVCVEYDNYGDFSKLLDFFCQLNGRKMEDVPAAKHLTEEVKKICDKTESLSAPRCAVIFAAASGFSLESSGTNTGMMLQMLGGKNILKERKFGRINFSYEQLMVENPDVIFIVTMGDEKALQQKFAKDFTSQPAWNELNAAKNRRVHFLPSELFLYMPGPDFPKAFRYLAALLYPGREWQ